MNKVPSLDSVLDRIELSDQQELQTLMDAIQDRCAILFPDWDVIYMALPKSDPKTRRQLLQHALDLPER